jgi:NAD(P)-dependent dehydrogenase (short-subunit alcohol dehydrogenase family)
MVQGRLTGKVAVVTGGASGIGLATVRRFVAEGAQVMIGDVDHASVASVTAELGDSVAGQACDVRNEADVKALFQTTYEELGSLDIAFANAGIGSFAPIMDTDLAEWRRVVDVNLIGTLLTFKYAARHMQAGGSIIATSSLNAVQASNGMSAYCATKAGLAMLVQVAALELGPRGIRANAIAPGLVRTPLTDAMWALPAVVEDFDENAPLDVQTSAEDVATLVMFLASDESSSITGTLQLIDRGAHLKRYPDLASHFTQAMGGASH